MKSKTNSITCSITPDHVPNCHHKIHASVEIRFSQSFTPTPNSFCTSTCLTPRVSAISPISPCPMSLISLYSCSNRICRFTVSDGSFLHAVLFSYCLFYTLLQDKRLKKQKKGKPRQLTSTWHGSRRLGLRFVLLESPVLLWMRGGLSAYWVG